MTSVSPILFSDLLHSLPDGANNKDAAWIQFAYEFAEKAHAGQLRKTGKLYLEHNLAVAHNMVELGVDASTIVAGLLHDILAPHTGVKETAVIQKFGKEVGTLVSGLANLYAYANEPQYQQLQLIEEETAQLEEIRRAILSIIEGDIRVILIRIADCLQELRQAHTLPLNRQRSIASEAMNIYAPLANRLGVWQLKWELEDLAFRYLEPIQYKEIASKLAYRRVEREEKIEQALTRLKDKITEAGIEVSINGRSKHIYSIHRKMVRKQLEFEQIYDLQALRVVLKSTNFESASYKNNNEIEEAERSLCYQVLGLVHGLWQPVPREFDDYIAAPKANGYQSLHTAVIDPQTGETLEVQIRSQRMHDEAEKGVAAHWAYKEEGFRVSATSHRRIKNLRDLFSTLREAENDAGDEKTVEKEMLADRIYVFTPKGKVVDLPIGATPIDFAYQIHTEVGHRCQGARINGKMVSLDYVLNSGERIEILTGKRAKPSRDWMNPTLGYTSSARTRSKIRQWFRTQEHDQNIIQGREVVERELKRLGLQGSHTIADIAKALKYEDVEEFLAQIGFGDIQNSRIVGSITRLQGKLKDDDELQPLLTQSRPRTKELTVKGMSGIHTRLANCCNPLPPEPIIGFTTRGKGVTVHRQDCKQVQATTEEERLIEVSWGLESSRYPISILVIAYKLPKLIDGILNILRGRKIPTPQTKTTTAPDGMTELYLIAEVEDIEQLNWLLNKLESLPNVLEARRQRWV